MNANINELLKDVDEVSSESESCVLESMLMSYVKTYDMLTNSDVDSVFQEAVDADAKKKSDNVLVKMIDTIIAFFKKIAKSIASFFSKTKEAVTKRLRKFAKSASNATEETIENVQKKVDNISKKASGSLNKLIKPNQVEEKKKEDTANKKDKSNSEDTTKPETIGVDVKERKIWTRINFKNWIKNLDLITEECDYMLTNSIRTTKRNYAKIFCERTYHFLPHRYGAVEVADYVDEIVDRLKKVNLKLDKLQTKMEEVKKHYSEFVNNTNPLPFALTRKQQEREDNEFMIKWMAKWVSQIQVKVQDMTAYLARELDIYGIILDTVEPVMAERRAKAEAEEAKKKAEEKEARTQHISIHMDKD